MTRRETEYLERFLDVSRVALGLAPEADPAATSRASAQGALANAERQASCPLPALDLTDAQRERLRARAFRDLRSVLTPYQRVQLDVQGRVERRAF